MYILVKIYLLTVIFNSTKSSSLVWIKVIIIGIGNEMISRAIWNKSTRGNLFTANKIAQDQMLVYSNMHENNNAVTC